MRRGPGSLYRRAHSIRFLLGRDRRAAIAFLGARYPVPLSLAERVRLLARFLAITNQVRAYHTQAELLTVADRILRRAGGAGPMVLEAGCGKGASTAKLSLVVRHAGGRLIACDSFRGLPENVEEHRHPDGRRVRFRAGAFAGRRREVERTLARFGAPEVVELRKGWFADTLPCVAGPLDVVLLDVDLLASTRTCLVELFPRLAPDGVLFSQDGHLEATVALLGNERFWRRDVGVEPPVIRGLGRAKLLEIRPAG